jgi:DNA-binding response OmpR family regulator
MTETRGTILVVEDEPEIRRFLRTSLATEGYRVVEAGSGARGAIDAGSQKPDLAIVDLGLPDIDGVDVIRRIRAWSPMPILVLSARAQERSKVEALDAGADDYVTKPFRLAEFLARVRALLRRGSTETSMAQGVRVDTEARRAWLGDTELDLTTKEFDLLSVLVNEAGKVVTREQIMREVWDSKWWGSTKTLDMHISWLRRKLGDDAQSPRYITTVRGVGFRFERGD